MNSESLDSKKSKFAVDSVLILLSDQKFAGISLGKIKKVYEVIAPNELREVDVISDQLPSFSEGEVFYTQNNLEECEWIVGPKSVPELINRKLRDKPAISTDSDLISQKRAFQIGTTLLIILPCFALLNFAISKAESIVSVSKIPFFLIAAGVLFGALFLLGRFLDRPTFANNMLVLGLIAVIASAVIPAFFTIVFFLLVAIVIFFFYATEKVVSKDPTAVKEDLWVIQNWLNSGKDSGLSRPSLNAFYVDDVKKRLPGYRDIDVDAYTQDNSVDSQDEN